MCVCVRTELARREPWRLESPQPATDYLWLHRLEKHQPQIRYVPAVIGIHV
jgi:hypothetical protein